MFNEEIKDLLVGVENSIVKSGIIFLINGVDMRKFLETLVFIQ